MWTVERYVKRHVSRVKREASEEESREGEPEGREMLVRGGRIQGLGCQQTPSVAEDKEQVVDFHCLLGALFQRNGPGPSLLKRKRGRRA